MSQILAYLESSRQQMLDDLKDFVERETPSTEKPLLDDFAQFLASYAEGMGGKAEIVESESSGNHVRVRWGDSRAAGSDSGGNAPILLVGHFDTVWPQETIERMPFSVTDGVASGPGIFDMKGGLVQGFWAVKALMETVGLERPVTFVCNSDEEIGSPESRKLITEETRRAQNVLVLEPSLEGALKTSRKGVGLFEVKIEGRPSHAGLDPEKGVSAVEELARTVVRLKGLADYKAGTTVNVGVIRGGTRYNVVAAEASAEVDVRAVSKEEAERVSELITKLEPENPETRLSVDGGMIWPPMERTEKIAGLYAKASRLADELGFELSEGAAGGASDGCLCADLGASVLDGLGAVGGGAHADNEHLYVGSMPPRSALAARLLETL